MSEQSGIPGQDTGQDTGPVQGVDHTAVSGPPTPVPASAPATPERSRPKSNAVAVVGLVLAVPVWPLGAILSLVGLVRSGKLGGTGRTLGIVGLALSLLVGAGSITFLALHRHKFVDPGCVSAKASVTAFRNTVLTDEAAIQKDRADGNTALVDNDIYGLVNDMISDEALIRKAQDAAALADLQNADSTMDGDLLTVITGYQALQRGDVSQTTQTEDASGAALADADKIDALCK